MIVEFYVLEGNGAGVEIHAWETCDLVPRTGDIVITPRSVDDITPVARQVEVVIWVHITLVRIQLGKPFRAEVGPMTEGNIHMHGSRSHRRPAVEVQPDQPWPTKVSEESEGPSSALGKFRLAYLDSRDAINESFRLYHALEGHDLIKANNWLRSLDDARGIDPFADPPSAKDILEKLGKEPG